ncbi:MAG: hypothetical protein JWO67_5863, partial [Streptosporangiaceae bacterium]|nr:hypothetical protein [Streptosporangiaceae bacterium]
RPQHRGTHHTVNEDQENPQVSEPLAAPATPGLPTPRDDPSRMSGGTTSNGAPNLAAHQLHVALTWVGRGMGVVPCSREDKAAMERGFGKKATPEELAKFYDHQQVEAWWRGRFKRAHVGLLTRSLVVIDLDMRKPGVEIPGRFANVQGGTDVLEGLVREAGAEWPDTYTVVTPSGGLHLYFLQPDGDPIGCATGDGTTPPHLGPLIDVRGMGGYVIAAGSYSATQGRQYTRTSPPELRPQPLPAWLLERLRPAAPAVAARPPAPVRRITSGATSSRTDRYAAAALEGAVRDIAAAAEGTLNTTLFARARRLGELSSTAARVLVEGDVVQELLAAAVAAGHPESGAQRTIRSGWERGLQDHAGTGAGAA